MERLSGAPSSPRSGGSGPPTSPALSVHVTDTDGGTSTIALAGELDLSTIARMEGPLLEQVMQRSAVLVDLSGLSFIDSSGIGVLIRTLRNANGTPVNVLIGAGSQVDRVFGIAGVTEALRVFTDREQALVALTEARDAHSQDGAG